MIVVNDNGLHRPSPKDSVWDLNTPEGGHSKAYPKCTSKSILQLFPTSLIWDTSFMPNHSFLIDA